MARSELAGAVPGPTSQVPLSGKPPEKLKISSQRKGIPSTPVIAFPRTHHAAPPSSTMALPSIPTALGHPHPPAGGLLLFQSLGDPTPRSALPFRSGDVPVRRCQTCPGPVLAARSPGLGNVDNLNESSSLSRSWDFSSQIDDDRDVLIECKDVHKSFGDKHVLRGVSFKIRHGEAVGIIGPSGTGKSTILKVMAGLLAPDKGDVIICGRKRHGLVSDEDISGLRIGLVFQSAALFDSLTVRENVGFLLYENSSLPEDRIGKLVTETLAAVGLKGVEDRMPSELSGGMKKRVALARSIIFDDTKEVIEPEVLLYDEPTAGLDPIASTVVEDLIRSVHMIGRDALGKPGKIASYVVVTHQHSTIRRAVDRLLFLHDGKVVWEGMTHEFTTSTNPIVQQFASGSLDGPIQYF
ncbi:protein TRIGALACTOSYLDIACYLGLYCEROL 3, chloroplastic-like [Phragmites australis]|uniref:protein TRIGALACTOSYLDIACYLGLYCEROL 3, chloroplastic-like n=1 Tax=Phragmites australis TaxID=29695 RepID=UPI002D764B47|nr:protein TRIGALACTOSYLDIACYLGLYCEROL 3, chloroplastic-like [Phragmites australis]